MKNTARQKMIDTLVDSAMESALYEVSQDYVEALELGYNALYSQMTDEELKKQIEKGELENEQK